MYPIRFTPLVLDKIWGGARLEKKFGKKPGELPNIGESWEISAVPGLHSVVENGHHAGKTLPELISEQKELLVGEKVYRENGVDFPLLLKLIDAHDDLSIQVHPGDDVAKARHNSLGKTEMWYVLDTDPGAFLIMGFREDTTPQAYMEAVEAGRVEELLQKVYVKPGDVFFIPAGLVHAIGRGTVIMEIQQSSDLTYRIYDYDRKDDQGNLRDLHLEEAMDVMNFSASHNPKTDYVEQENAETKLVECPYFQTNLLLLDRPMEISEPTRDSFTALMCVEGEVEITGGSETVTLSRGETVLIPAAMQHYTLIPKSAARLLKVKAG